MQFSSNFFVYANVLWVIAPLPDWKTIDPLNQNINVECTYLVLMHDSQIAEGFLAKRWS